MSRQSDAMSQIEVPDWVAQAYIAAYHHAYDTEELPYMDSVKAAITAALGAWVVPAGYMDAKAELLLPRPGRCVLSSQTVLVRDAYEGRNLPLYTLRQEKPE
jgi:hypothetical protein